MIATKMKTNMKNTATRNIRPLHVNFGGVKSFWGVGENIHLAGGNQYWVEYWVEYQVQFGFNIGF